MSERGHGAADHIPLFPFGVCFGHPVHLTDAFKQHMCLVESALWVHRLQVGAPRSPLDLKDDTQSLTWTMTGRIHCVDFKYRLYRHGMGLCT